MARSSSPDAGGRGRRPLSGPGWHLRGPSRPCFGSWGIQRTKAELSAHSLARPRLEIPARQGRLKTRPAEARVLAFFSPGRHPEVSEHARRRGQRLCGQPRTTQATLSAGLWSPRWVRPPPTSRSNLPGATTHDSNYNSELSEGRRVLRRWPRPAPPLVRAGGGGTRRLSPDPRLPKLGRGAETALVPLSRSSWVPTFPSAWTARASAAAGLEGAAAAEKLADGVLSLK